MRIVSYIVESNRHDIIYGIEFNFDSVEVGIIENVLYYSCRLMIYGK